MTGAWINRFKEKLLLYAIHGPYDFEIKIKSSSKKTTSTFQNVIKISFERISQHQWQNFQPIIFSVECPIEALREDAYRISRYMVGCTCSESSCLVHVAVLLHTQ
jgi:hypothetical protein